MIKRRAEEKASDIVFATKKECEAKIAKIREEEKKPRCEANWMSSLMFTLLVTALFLEMWKNDVLACLWTYACWLWDFICYIFTGDEGWYQLMHAIILLLVMGGVSIVWETKNKFEEEHYSAYWHEPKGAKKAWVAFISVIFITVTEGKDIALWGNWSLNTVVLGGIIVASVVFIWILSSID